MWPDPATQAKSKVFLLILNSSGGYVQSSPSMVCLPEIMPVLFVVGSISAALSCLVYPPREERLNAWAAKLVCDVNSQLKFLRRFPLVGNVIWQSFFFLSRAELFDCGVSNDMSKVTHLLVCIVLTSCFRFASSVCFDLFWKFDFVQPRRRLVLLSFKKTTVHINLLEYFCFLEIDVCVYPSLCWLCSLSDILARHDSNTIGWGSRKKSVDYFVCSVCRCGIDQALFHQLKVFG